MTSRQMDKVFTVELGTLVRCVLLADGRVYRHRCTLETLTAVAYCIEQHAEEGITTNMLWKEVAPRANTQISVALDYLKERGYVVTHWRRSFPASVFVVEDALIEFHALREGAPGTIDAGPAAHSQPGP